MPHDHHRMSLSLLTGLALVGPFLLAAPTAADWIVTLQGKLIETQGRWTIEGTTLRYTDTEGQPQTIDLAEVDLEGSYDTTEMRTGKPVPRQPAPVQPTPERPKNELASTSDRSDPRMNPALRTAATRYATKLLEADKPDLVMDGVRNLSSRSLQEREVYYDELLKRARQSLQAKGTGGTAKIARFILCGSSRCRPAPFWDGTHPFQPPRADVREASHPGVTAPRKLHAPQPRFTKVSREARTHGRVMIQAVVDERGTLTDPVVLMALPFGLTESAVETVLKWKYDPARFEGRAVPVYTRILIHFELGANWP